VLTEFEEQHEALDVLIKALLRSYEGVFDFPATINETQLAKFIRQDKELVMQQLQQLVQFGIVSYQPQKDKPQIVLLQNRMYADSFVINLNEYIKRKQLFEQRVNAMVAFTESTRQCRSIQIADYFSGSIEKKCGICDNCINQQSITLSKEEFDAIHQHILTVVNEGAVSISGLLLPLPKAKKEQYWKVLDYLQEEGKIFLNKEAKLVNKL
jgi:ATP-dependent DNA helicase RecQ